MVQRPCWRREWNHVASRRLKDVYFWCCVNCGDCLDETIAFHRAQQAEPPPLTQHELVWNRIKDAVGKGSR